MAETNTKKTVVAKPVAKKTPAKAPAKKVEAPKAPVKKPAVAKAPAKKVEAPKAPAKKPVTPKAPAKPAPTKKVEAPKAPVAKKTEVTKAPAKPAPTKKVEAPKTTSPTSLPKEVFDVKINTQAIFDAIMSERAADRQGTHKVKTRGEVRGGGRKPFAQKGTGNARQGSIRSPQWVGGGVVWGPTPERNYKLKVNKKVKRLAYNSALSLKAKDNAVLVNDFTEIKTKPSTKAMIKAIEGLKLKSDQKKVLIVTNNEKVWKSVSNLEKVFATRLSSLTIQSVVNADVIVFSKDTLAKLGGK